MSITSKLKRALGLTKKRRKPAKKKAKARKRRTPPRNRDGEFRKRR
jgi:hypothetical protein